MNSPFQHQHIPVQLGATARLHLWMKPLLAGQCATLHLRRGGQDHVLASSGASGFAFFDLALTGTGAAAIVWNPNDTDIGCLYAHEPESVQSAGIDVLHAPHRAGHVSDLRFCPPMGWMNDPNGLVWAQGRFHLFYQHYPLALRWDSMHWGHAVSDDMITWVHQPIALIPAQATADGAPLGMAFSGSAIAAGDGLRLFFTDHAAARSPKEFQRTALLRDGLHADPADTIIATMPTGLGLSADFRDPYVFTGPDGGLHMVVGTRDDRGGVVLHYTTAQGDGTAGWQFQSVLHEDAKDGTTVAECPCFVPVSGAADDPSTLWALIYARMDAEGPAQGLLHPTTAVIGHFDGAKFAPLFSQVLDMTCGSYAWQAFVGPQGTLAMGWLANWADWDRASDFPTAMALPRQIVLSQDKTAVLTPVVDALKSLRGAALPADAALDGQKIDLPPNAEIALICAPAAGATLLTLKDGTIIISVDAAGWILSLGQAAPVRIPHQYGAGQLCTLSLFIDSYGVEVFIDDGRWTASQRFATPLAVRDLTLTCPPSQNAHLAIWPLSPANPRPKRDRGTL